jgi:hypothetical protein
MTPKPQIIKNPLPKDDDAAKLRDEVLRELADTKRRVKTLEEKIDRVIVVAKKIK